MDVVEVPDKKKSPNAHRFIRDKLNRGVLEPASKAEYEEVQEAFEESRAAFNERLEDLAALGVEPTRMGFAIHQEGAVQTRARVRRERLQKNSKSEAERDYELDRERRARISGNAPEEESDEDYESWKNDRLREELDEREIEYSGNPKKAEMAALLEADDEERRAAEEDEEE